ncbi:hypothetical protein YC2023_002643 [Brassica napus]
MANGEKSGGDSSSEEEDPNGKAAINSIATTTLIIVAGQDMLQNQVKKLLSEMVESTLDFVSMFPRMKNRIMTVEFVYLSGVQLASSLIMLMSFKDPKRSLIYHRMEESRKLLGQNEAAKLGRS